MSPEREYTEEEVAEILDRATQVDRSPSTSAGGSGRGLTLAELHDIGREVGIAEDVITRAARQLDAHPSMEAAPDRRLLGSTIGVGRTTYLPRMLTDEEWNQLVVDLRDTFDARGKIRDQGAFRQWTNGNLQALVEPTGEGARLRLRTVKGSGQVYLGMGAAMLAFAPIAAVLALLGTTGDVTSGLTFAVMGAALVTWAKVTLPSWAKTRERQMEEIIERLTRSMQQLEAGDSTPPRLP